MKPIERVGLGALVVVLGSLVALARAETAPPAAAGAKDPAESVASVEAPPAPPDVAAPPEDAQRTESGLATKVLAVGSGTLRPRGLDTVTVHYTGWTTDGKAFDSSVGRGKPLTVSLQRLIPGWIEGLELMVVGEKRRLWIPEDIGFRGHPQAPKGMVVFDVELLDIEPGPDTPSDVAAPPEDAVRTRSGLASKVLKAGNGDRHPTAQSQVTVHYTGWTTDGKMFDSTALRGKPANFRLDRVIAGWTEGLALMVEGEKRRFWIPEKLAYKGEAGRPAGMLVFDIELLAIQN